AVGGEIGTATDAVGDHEREALLRLLGADQLEWQPERPRPRHLTAHLLLAFRGAREADAAALDPAAVELAVGLHAVHHHPRQRDAAPQLADEPRRMEGGPAGQLVAIQEDDVPLPERREVVGDRGAADTAADDHDARSLRQCGGTSQWSHSSAVGKVARARYIRLAEMARALYLLRAMKLDELRGEVERGSIDTVLLAITDMQGRLMGKRLVAEHFL